MLKFKYIITSSLIVTGLIVTGCSSESASTVVTQTLADEPYYKYLWHIDSKNSNKEKIAQEISNALYGENILEPINPEADINLLDAWSITKGKDVVVAIIDDGADTTHQDLKENIYLTYNADNDTSDVSNEYNDISKSSHGNSCAGCIASPINEIGIIGAAPESKLMIIKQDENDDIKTIRAFEYAKNNGAKVISCSWGTNNVSQAVVAELKSLYDAGITVVFASGNEGDSLDVEGIYDESEVQWVIGVGATSEQNDVTSYSNYGKNIDILAPAGDTSDSIGILSLDDTGTQGSTQNYSVVSNSYAFTNGTSFAAPVAAGVIALMYSVNPNITALQVKNILTSTATKIGAANANYINGFDEKRAYGKIDALRAVEEAKKLL